MKIVSSYAVQLKPLNFDIMPTVKIYREAVSFCIEAFDKEWLSLSVIEKSTKELAKGTN